MNNTNNETAVGGLTDDRIDELTWKFHPNSLCTNGSLRHLCRAIEREVLATRAPDDLSGMTRYGMKMDIDGLPYVGPREEGSYYLCTDVQSLLATKAEDPAQAAAAQVPEGAAIDSQGTAYHSIAEMYHRFEEGEALHMWLDDQKVPRSDAKGKVYSLVGRVMRLLESAAPSSQPSASVHIARQAQAMPADVRDAALVELLDLAYKGLRDWELPDNRYRALEAIDKFRVLRATTTSDTASNGEKGGA